jgi:hypothetical protein
MHMFSKTLRVHTRTPQLDPSCLRLLSQALMLCFITHGACSQPSHAPTFGIGQGYVSVRNHVNATGMRPANAFDGGVAEEL